MSKDNEIEAIERISAALEQLDEDARTRVLRWARSRFLGEKVPDERADEELREGAFV